MIVTVDDFLNSARDLIGVRFHHQGRTTGGLDCVGLVILAAKNAGIQTTAGAITGYGKTPGNADFKKWIGRYTEDLRYNRLQRISDQVRPGDLLTFWIENTKITRHVGIYLGADSQGVSSMVHSYAKARRGVVQQVMDTYWNTRVTGAYRIKEFCTEGE